MTAIGSGTGVASGGLSMGSDDGGEESGLATLIGCWIDAGASESAVCHRYTQSTSAEQREL